MLVLMFVLVFVLMLVPMPKREAELYVVHVAPAKKTAGIMHKPFGFITDEIGQQS